MRAVGAVERGDRAGALVGVGRSGALLLTAGAQAGAAGQARRQALTLFEQPNNVREADALTGLDAMTPARNG